METIKQILMRRDEMTSEDADEMVEAAKREFREEGGDPEEIIAEWFGLEPDYAWELLD